MFGRKPVLHAYHRHVALLSPTPVTFILEIGATERPPSAMDVKVNALAAIGHKDAQRHRPIGSAAVIVDSNIEPALRCLPGAAFAPSPSQVLGCDFLTRILGHQFPQAGVKGPHLGVDRLGTKQRWVDSHSSDSLLDTLITGNIPDWLIGMFQPDASLFLAKIHY